MTIAFWSGFDPRAISGLSMWQRADLGITLNYSRVSKWADQSGYGNDLTAIDPNQPTYTKSDAANGRPALLFTGAQKMSTGNITISQPNTIFLIARLSVLTGNPGLFDDATNRQIGYVSNAGTTWSMDAGATLTGGTPDTNVHAMAFVFNGATSSLYIDNATAPVMTGNAGNNLGSGGYILGTQSTGYATGAIYEHALYNRALTAGSAGSELGQLFSYAQLARPAASVPSVVVFAGNSIMKGYDAFPLDVGVAGLTASAFPSVLAVNDSFAGYTTPQVNAQAPIGTDPHYSPLRPKNIVIMNEVVNDYNSGSSVAQCLTNLEAYRADRKAVGWDVAFTTILPNYVIPSGDLATINAAIRSLSLGNDFVVDWESQSAMGNASNINNLMYYIDRLHPATYGHSLITSITVSSLQSRM